MVSPADRHGGGGQSESRKYCAVMATMERKEVWLRWPGSPVKEAVRGCVRAVYRKAGCSEGREGGRGGTYLGGGGRRYTVQHDRSRIKLRAHLVDQPDPVWQHRLRRHLCTRHCYLLKLEREAGRVVSNNRDLGTV